MYNCPNDNEKLILTGEEGVNAWFRCSKCNKWYIVDLRDDSIEIYKEQYENN
ncbi:hypothetical protein [Clostridium sp.]|uniref:hypothetical protein n=1 Tax=Clostridium sp. TaxID=1506 RepID=UPI002616F84B|nr:hypothetical protein [Clostridium sp.]